jgi:hypothetical protein
LLNISYDNSKYNNDVFKMWTGPGASDEVYTTWTSNTLTLQSRALFPGSLPPIGWWALSVHETYLSSSCLLTEHDPNMQQIQIKHLSLFKIHSLLHKWTLSLQYAPWMSLTLLKFWNTLLLSCNCYWTNFKQIYYSNTWPLHYKKYGYNIAITVIRKFL